MFVDLQKLGTVAKTNYQKSYKFSEYSPSDEFLSDFKNKFEDKNSGAQLVPGEHTATIITSTNNTIDFPYSLFLRVSYFLDFAKAYSEYGKIINKVIHNNLQHLTHGSGLSELQFRTKVFEILKDTQPDLSNTVNKILSDWETSLLAEVSTDYVYTYFLSPLYDEVKGINDDEIKFMFRFLSDNDWSYTGKSPIRYDGIGSALMGLMKVVQVKQGVIPDLVDVLINNNQLLEQAKKDANNFKPFSILTLPSATKFKAANIIYYGAPGTGKSYSIDKVVVDDFTIRTVFHTDTQNSDFIGCLKPVIENDEITYKFRSGPFTDAVVNALIDPVNHYWLVIEEINRAPAAAVFGEIFQLLDRDMNGNSKYQIDIGDPDMLADINKRLKDSDISSIDKLYIPGNLSVLATMNSSDQAVMPMDTAFKRRWQFRYIPLDFDHDYASGTLPIPDGSGSVIDVTWKEFAIGINTTLSENGIPEDRHLGPFFLSEEEMSVHGGDRKEILTGKLFMYLWDDVLRHGYRETIFSPEIKTYGQLNKMFNEDKDVFSKGFRGLLSKNYPVQKEEFEGFPQAAEPAADD